MYGQQFPTHGPHWRPAAFPSRRAPNTHRHVDAIPLLPACHSARAGAQHLIAVSFRAGWRQTAEVNSDLYPDLAAAGSLAALLEQTAAGLDVALTVLPDKWGSLTAASIAASVPERRPLSVCIGAESRWFGVSGWSQGIELITGGTSDLAAIVGVGIAWGEGRSLRELKDQLPFLHSNARAEAHEQGPAAVVELQWRAMREEAAQAPDFHEFAELVEATHAEPHLRQLCVFSSHWTLGFSSCTGFPFRVEVAIAPSRNGSPYLVMEHPHSTVIGEAASVEGAVALAVSHLPTGLGPAVAGTADTNE